MFKSILSLLIVFILSCSSKYENENLNTKLTKNSLDEINVIGYNSKEGRIKINFPDQFEYNTKKGDDGKFYRRYKAESSYRIPYEPGSPEILNKTFWFQIPNDAKNIKISLLNLELKKLNDQVIDLYPVPINEFETLEDGTVIQKEIFYKNDQIYNSNIWLPEQNVNILEDSFIHGLRALKVSIPTMSYNPSISQVSFYKSADISITYNSRGNSFVISSVNDPFHKIYLNKVVNYSYKLRKDLKEKGQVKIVRGTDLTNINYARENNFYPNYLIISASRFDNNESSIHTLADYRSNNLDICLVYLDDIYEQYSGSTIQLKIQSFISFVYHQWRKKDYIDIPNLQYLLLVGDADWSFDEKDWFFPTWRSTPPDDNSAHTGDNDYACLEGNDFMPDLLLGRLPAQNETELSTMVHKTINFEKNPPHGENHYGTRVLWLGGKSLDNDCSFPDASNIRNFLVSKSIEIDEYNQNYLRDYLNNDFLLNDDKQIIDYLENKGSLFLIYSGHGAKDYPGWVLPLSEYSPINNYDIMPALIFSASCNTAWFDNAVKIDDVYYPKDSTGEKWVKSKTGGSVMFLGWTRVIYWSVAALYESFIKSIYGNKNYIVSSSIYESLMDFSSVEYLDILRKRLAILGDPALDVSLHIKESSKPDFSIDALNLSPDEPSSFKEEVIISMKMSSKVPENYDNLDVPLNIYSIESGKYENFISDETVSFKENSSIDFKTSYYFDSVSSIHLNPVLDPYNKIDELSEYNNQNKHYIKYYPIYVDPNSSNFDEFGTKSEPFKDIQTAISHTFSPSSGDLINNSLPAFIPSVWTNKGKDFKQIWYMDKENMLKIYLEKGVHGQKKVLNVSKNVILKGISKNNVYLTDGLILNGNFNIIDSITFDGSLINNMVEAISIKNPAPEYPIREETLIIRNQFLNWPDFAVSSTIDDYRYLEKALNFKNNIFHNNYGVVNYTNNYFSSGFMSKYINNTIFANQNNLHINFCDLCTTSTRFDFRSNIIKNNGLSYTNKPSLFYVGYLRHNNIDDEILIEQALPLPIPLQIVENFNLDSQFYGEKDFHLSPGSPCIDTGDPGISYFEQQILDPDGSPNDRGAYGGPDAVVKDLIITYPTHSETISYQPISSNFSYPVIIPIIIRWNAFTLDNTELLDVYLYHLDENSIEVPDFDVIAENTSSLGEYFKQTDPIKQYYLKIKSLANPDISDQISFISNVGGEINKVSTNR